MATATVTHRRRFKSVSRSGILFALLIAYVVLAMTVVEQGRTIEEQKTLIRQLWLDSAELNAIKIKQVQERLLHKK